MPSKKIKTKSGAELLVDCLRVQGVKYIFGIPGAAIMPILEILRRDNAKKGAPEFVLCRHEQNAAFMAQAYGRLTGQPGVCLATAGPGATNLVTGVATATQDRDPVIALTGSNPIPQHMKNVHQNVHTRNLFAAISKRSVEVEDVNSIPEVVSMAFRLAKSQRPGAVHLTFPTDIQNMSVSRGAVPIQEKSSVPFGDAPKKLMREATLLLKNAKCPVLLLGVGSTANEEVTRAVRQFIQKIGVPVVGTFEAAGAVPRSLVSQFIGRVGLKAKEPGDIALEEADVLVTVGYDPIEYSPTYWSKKKNCKIIHIDFIASEPDRAYQPDIELVGDIASNLTTLCRGIGKRFSLSPKIRKAQKFVVVEQARGSELNGSPIHPLRFIYDLRNTIGDDVTVISDVGSHQVWLAKYFYCYEPKHLLFSMGFQTVGVALPWAMATTLARPHKPVVAICGDGGFLMTGTELETAVRYNMPLVLIVWRSEGYNLVEIQQLETYKKSFGISFSNPDIVDFAKSFGAEGLRIERPEDIVPTIEKALSFKKPVVIDVPIDYRDNLELLKPSDLVAFH